MRSLNSLTRFPLLEKIISRGSRALIIHKPQSRRHTLPAAHTGVEAGLPCMSIVDDFHSSFICSVDLIRSDDHHRSVLH